MAELLLELFSEEIPARMQQKASLQLKELALKKLSEASLDFEHIDTYVTPRRLTMVVTEIPILIPETQVEKRGPRVNAPKQAIDGFLRSNNLQLNQLTKKDDFYFANITSPQKDTYTLAPSIVESMLDAFTWPKSMRWNDHQIEWVRPLKNILCIFDSQVVRLKYGHLEANNITWGHRFLAGDHLKIGNFKDYHAKLEKNFVILCAKKRRENILKQIKTLIAEKNLTLKADSELLEEVTGLVEWPIVLMGEINKEFMNLPPEVLSTAMRAHQKYFSLLDHKGNLAPYFIVVSNMKAYDKGKSIIAGNERVLQARLYDAKFFYEQDLAKNSESQLNGLEKVIFHEKLGSYLDKTNRIAALTGYLTDKIDSTRSSLAKRAALLCKTDLITEMVGEFPELQGVMGGYYAKAGGEDNEVVNAIREHYYFPVMYNNTGKATQNKLSIIVALADKMDTLVGLFAVGEKPTGSKDPYALRRSALSIINIILDNDIRISLHEFISKALSLLPKNLQEPAVVIELASFFADRLKVILKSASVRHDMIDAVFDGGKDDDIYRLNMRAVTLNKFINTEDGNNLLTAYRRASNIVANEESKDNVKYNGIVKQELLEKDAEKQLAKAFSVHKQPIEQAISEENFGNAMTELATLRSAVDNFFDKVIVNSDNLEIRKNRLYLLSELRSIMDKIANFSRIEG